MKNILKKKIMNKEILYGTHVNLADPCICDIVGRLGYDFIWVDMEHSYLSYKDLLSHIIAAKGTGTPVIVRIPQNDLTATKKILEMGPDGVIFPMVRSKEEIDRLMGYTLYPHRKYMWIMKQGEEAVIWDTPWQNLKKEK